MEPPETTTQTIPFRAFAPPQILRVDASKQSTSVVGAQDDNRCGFDEPVLMFEVRWGE